MLVDVQPFGPRKGGVGCMAALGGRAACGPWAGRQRRQGRWGWWLVDGEPEDHDVLVLAVDLLAAGLFLILAVSAGGWWWLLVAGWGGLAAAQGRLVLRSTRQAGASGPPAGCPAARLPG